MTKVTAVLTGGGQVDADVGVVGLREPVAVQHRRQGEGRQDVAPAVLGDGPAELAARRKTDALAPARRLQDGAGVLLDPRMAFRFRNDLKVRDAQIPVTLRLVAHPIGQDRLRVGQDALAEGQLTADALGRQDRLDPEWRRLVGLGR